MNKIAVVTIFEDWNYGNKLQNYAVEQLYLAKEYQPETLDYSKKNLKEILRNKFHTVTNYRFTKYKDVRLNRKKREKNFKEFDQNFLHVKQIENIRKQKNEYEIFSVGSDQVWNTNWLNYYLRDLFLLKFASDKRKMSIAASFGVLELSKRWKRIFKKELLKYEGISVREEQGKAIVDSMGIDGCVAVMDPTLYFGKEKWKTIWEKPTSINEEKMLVTYFLGDVSDDVKEQIKHIANKRNLQIVALNDVNDLRYYYFSPQEFLYCIGNAELVVTDSFHACVFSFIFERPFWVLERAGKENDIMSRVDSFLDTYNLSERKVKNLEDIDVFESDYSEGKKQLVIEREKLDSYIDSVLLK